MKQLAMIALCLASCSSESAAPPTNPAHYRLTTSIAAGQEAERCLLVHFDGGFVTSDTIRSSIGTHHVIVYETTYSSIPMSTEDGRPIAPGEVFDCSSGAPSVANIARILTGSQVAGEGAQSGTIRFPEGVAMEIGPKVLLLNGHFLNTSAAPITAEVELTLERTDRDSVRERGDVLVWYHPFVFAPEQASTTARMRCEVKAPITIDTITSHMHARGVGFEAIAEDAEIYSTSSWQNVTPVLPPGGRTLAAGWVDFACTYTNPGATAVYQGATSGDEMCALIAAYHPADPTLSLCSTDADDPIATAYLAAEWVGAGVASCSETFACSLPPLTRKRSARCPHVSQRLTPPLPL